MPEKLQRAGRGPVTSSAPGRLESVRAFVNTLDIEEGTDELRTPAQLMNWLRANDVVTGRGRAGGAPQASTATDADLRQAIALREGLRAVLRAHASLAHAGPAHPRPADVGPAQVGPAQVGQKFSIAGPVTDLRRIAAILPTRLDISDDGQVTVVRDGESPAAGLARILLIAAEASSTGIWSRLKVCSAQDCQWAFYDRSPTRSGCWCSMAVCGSRAKSRAYRQRAGALR